MGTSVVQGSAVAVVIATGKNTFLGKLATEILVKKPINNFERETKKISLTIMSLIMFFAPIVLLIS
jgi:Mg2+-importing ATPase